MSEQNGFIDITKCEFLKPGDKVYYINRDKSMYLAVIGTEKLENSRKELQDFVIYVLDKQQELKVLDETFTKERTEILKIMKNNFELYQKVNFILETNFQKALQDYQN